MSPNFHVDIEPTNQCNTQCLHCPHTSITRPLGKMEMDTFQTVIAKAGSIDPNFSVEFCGIGEPLLHPHIYDFIQAVSPTARFVALTSNGSALTDKNAQRLVQAGLTRLTVSFNGHTRELYELMMGGLSFERATQNLRRIVEASKGTQLEVWANVSVTKQTEAHLAQIRDYLEGAGVEHIFFAKCHTRGGFMMDDCICSTPLTPVESDRCDVFTDTLFVSWTGQVLACCQDLAGSNVLGDLKTDRMEDILAKRAQIAAGGVHFDICKYCNDLFRFKNDLTPDGSSIADWVYNLYVDGPTPALSASTALSQWIYAMYEQEGQGPRLTALLGSQLREQQKASQVQQANYQAQLQELGARVQELQAQVEAQAQGIEQRSDLAWLMRNWRTTKQAQQARRTLFPLGSRRDALLKKLRHPGL